MKLSVFLGGAQKIQSGHTNYAGHWRSVGVVTQILHYFFNKIENAQQAEPSCDDRYPNRRHGYNYQHFWVGTHNCSAPPPPPSVAPPLVHNPE